MTGILETSRRQPLMTEPQAMERFIVTIDGPAGTGKSSVALELARRLDFDFLDTGAMYRAAAALALDHGLDPSDDAGVMRVVQQAGIVFDWEKSPPRIMAEGRAMHKRIRKHDVTAVVSRIAANAELRRMMVASQRQIAEDRPRLVTEGRDQGTVVFPHADVKFYLDADPKVRASRRATQLRTEGIASEERQLLQEINDRDRSDASRVDGPMMCPADAIRVDTTPLDFDAVVSVLEGHVRASLATRQDDIQRP